MAQGASPGFDPDFFRGLVLRQVRQDYLENLTGFAWLILQPLMLLAVYAFVFTTVFKARLPEDAGVDFVPFLAVAFWPWTAFSEAVLRASGSISANAGLISKVAFAREQLPLATVTATFLMHMVGYLAVLLLLQVTGTPIHWMLLVATLPVLVLLWLLACALGLFFSALQVFVRDLAQFLPPLMTFWFFLTPILYPRELLPEWLGPALAWNPMAWFVDELRGLLLFGQFGFGWSDLLVLLGVLLACWLALLWFRRLAGHFEDFL